MKVSIARIRLYLKEGKTLADGSNPIMLMCSFYSIKKIPTAFTSGWDFKSNKLK